MQENKNRNKPIYQNQKKKTKKVKLVALRKVRVTSIFCQCSLQRFGQTLFFMFIAMTLFFSAVAPLVSFHPSFLLCSKIYIYIRKRAVHRGQPVSQIYQSKYSFFDWRFRFHGFYLTDSITMQLLCTAWKLCLRQRQIMTEINNSESIFVIDNLLTKKNKKT